MPNIFQTRDPRKIDLDTAWRDEFSAYEPDPDLASKEGKGSKGWAKGYQLETDHYPLMEILPHTFHYPDFIVEMLRTCWITARAQKKPNRPQRQLAGNHRKPWVLPGTKKTIATKYKVCAANAVGTAPPPRLVYGAHTDPQHLKGVAKDWCRHLDFDRVKGYGFRGDSRPPLTIKAAGGFNPPKTRNDDWYIDNKIIPNFQDYMKERFGTDIDARVMRDYIKGKGGDGITFVYYEVWRDMLEKESLHLGRMISDEFLKGYISTSRSTSIAKAYAGEKGWVYVLYVQGAFVLGAQDSNEWLLYGEQELAMPGKVRWDQVYGFREMGPGPKFKVDGPIFLRKGFKDKDNSSFEEVYQLLSGKKQ
jgi:hypothetical protein